MNPLCEKCKGACCETLMLPVEDFKGVMFLRGRTVGHFKGGVLLSCKCSYLTSEGKCGIYEQRPSLCRTFEVGSGGCLETLKAVRPELYEEGLKYAKANG